MAIWFSTVWSKITLQFIEENLGFGWPRLFDEYGFNKAPLFYAISGKKVVSVSRTPGHTKHFQTIYLTKTVCLCDCPGLVFPSMVSKQLQILMGSFPIAQVREPYTTVKFLAERVNLPKLLKIPHPENDDTWSAMDICDGWAIKRNFKTARAARLDTYRAANSLLRLTLEGKICLYIYPPKWTIQKGIVSLFLRQPLLSTYERNDFVKSIYTKESSFYMCEERKSFLFCSY